MFCCGRLEMRLIGSMAAKCIWHFQPLVIAKDPNEIVESHIKHAILYDLYVPWPLFIHSCTLLSFKIGGQLRSRE